MNRTDSLPALDNRPPQDPHSALTDARCREVDRRCLRCGLCRNECAFLKRYGMPGDIARDFDPGRPVDLKMAFDCSLCGLCQGVCPQDLDLPGMFLQMRREAENRGCNGVAGSCTYVDYESRGISPHLSYTGLPSGCDTVYFPGCALPAIRPGRTLALFQHLQKTIPALGIVLDCCIKPSHDLGRQAWFEHQFGILRDMLAANGVARVLVNCPNCYKIFRQYGRGLQTESVYRYLDRRGAAAPSPHPARPITIHDPCVLRFEEPLQQTVRDILRRGGWRIEERRHHGRTTLCCGNGASVDCAAPDLARGWEQRCGQESNGMPVVTYCAGCANRLSATHLLDLMLPPYRPALRRQRHLAFPLTCYHRARLKKRLQALVPTAVDWQRPVPPAPPDGRFRLNRRCLSLLISRAVSRLA